MSQADEGPRSAETGPGRGRSKPPPHGLARMLLACIAIVIILAMLIYGVPRFQAFFAESGSQLPGPTRFVLRASSLVKGWPVVFLPLAAGVMAGLVALPLLVRRPVNRVIGAALVTALIGVLLGMVLSLYVPLLALAGQINE